MREGPPLTCRCPVCAQRVKGWGNFLGSLREGANRIIEAPAPGLNHPPPKDLAF